MYIQLKISLLCLWQYLENERKYVSVFGLESGLHHTVVTVPFLTASLLGLLFSDMVRVVNCHAGVLQVRILADPKDFLLGFTSLVAEVIW